MLLSGTAFWPVSFSRLWPLDAFFLLYGVRPLIRCILSVPLLFYWSPFGHRRSGTSRLRVDPSWRLGKLDSWGSKQSAPLLTALSCRRRFH